MDHHRNRLTTTNQFQSQYFHPDLPRQFISSHQSPIQSPIYNNYDHYGFSNSFNSWNSYVEVGINHHSYQNYYLEALNTEEKYGLLNPPPLNHPVPQVHFKYLQQLKQNIKFDGIKQKPPHVLINYLLQFLSLQDCPYPLTALTFMSINIPNFPYTLAHYQLQHLIKTLNLKYPQNIDYGRQYKKLQIMDKKKSYKLLDLMQALCIISCTIQQYYLSNEHGANNLRFMIPKHYYINWIVNYVLVLFESFEEQQGQYQNGNTLWLNQAIYTNLNQMKSLLSHQNHQFLYCTQNRKKIIQIIYQMIPKTQLISSIITQQQGYSQNQHKSLFDYIQLYLTSCNKININGEKQLYNYIQLKLQEKIQQIGSLAHRIKQLTNNNDIKMLFQAFSFKILNILNIKIWTKQQKLSYIHLLYGCRFVCGLGNMINQEDPSNEIIELAFSIAKEKDVGVKRNNKVTKNLYKGKPHIKVTQSGGEIDCDQFW